jgi:uncharacterized protein YqeY
MIYEKINSELKEALKAKDEKKSGILRMIISALRNKEIEKKGAGKEPVLTEEEVLDLVKKEAKKRKEAITLYEQGGRPELAAVEKSELELIQTYLPAEMSREEIEKIVLEIKNSGVSEFNVLIKEAMARLKGQADGKLVAEIVKSVL